MRSHQNYINKNRSRAVKNLLIMALKTVTSDLPKQAIDLGCGLGIETAYLSQLSNWRVLAIDNNSELLDQAQGKIEPRHKEHIQFLNVSFESVTTLPSCDLLYCYHSLHFIDHVHYERIWNLILSSIRINGTLAISLFGPTDAMVKRNRAIGISEPELKSRLVDFEIEYFDTVMEKSQETLHYFEVIAKKIK